MYTVANDERIISFQGNRLRKLRNRAGLSQEELAEQLNVNQQEVSDWERGKLPETKNVQKILTYFKVRPDYIFNYSDDEELPPEPPPQPDFVDDLIAAVGENDLNKLQEVIARIRKLKK